MTPENYEHMVLLAERYEARVRQVLAKNELPWHVTRIGARIEYLFLPHPPRNGGEVHRGRNALLEACIHLFLLNRGVLPTPFHNMALMCPFTESGDVDLHGCLPDECLAELRALG